MKDKRKGKLEKHFPILINGHEVKILSYRVKEENGRQLLTLKTLIESPWIKGGRLVGRTGRISIGTEESLQDLRCYGCCATCGPPPWSADFYILKEGDRISHGEVLSSESAGRAEN